MGTRHVTPNCCWTSVKKSRLLKFLLHKLVNEEEFLLDFFKDKKLKKIFVFPLPRIKTNFAHFNALKKYLYHIFNNIYLTSVL